MTIAELLGTNEKRKIDTNKRRGIYIDFDGMEIYD
jgi:hypothetical protein